MTAVVYEHADEKRRAQIDALLAPPPDPTNWGDDIAAQTAQDAVLRALG